MTAHLSAADYRAMRAKTMNELDDLTPAVIDLAIRSGWRVHHSRPARTAQGWRTPLSGHKGLPDLVMVHPDGGVVMAELKSERGNLSTDQAAWAALLRDVDRRGSLGAERVFRYFVWRPSDWLNGSIEEVLRCR